MKPLDRLKSPIVIVSNALKASPPNIILSNLLYTQKPKSILEDQGAKPNLLYL